jgi:hypothetical protein
MATVREPDPLATFLVAQQKCVLECLTAFVRGEGAGRLSRMRTLIRALGEAEAEVLYPALARLPLPAELALLLADSRDSRARQLDAIDALAHKRGPRLRKLAGLELTDQIQHHFQQHVSELVPALASRSPRVVYRAIAARFAARCQAGLEAAKSQRPARAA